MQHSQPFQQKKILNLLCPAENSKASQEKEMKNKKANMKATIKKQILCQESPVHGPFEEKLTAKVEGTCYISSRINKKEWSSKNNLVSRPIQHTYTHTSERKTSQTSKHFTDPPE